jgi:HIP---CoA ligase
LEEPVELTIPAALARAARVHGEALALAEPDGPRLTWRQLGEQAATVGRALMAAGVVPGDRVAIWSANTRHWVLGALGALQAGATVVPVSTRFTGPEALDVIGRSGARVLLVADWFLGTDRLARLQAAACEPDGLADLAGLRLAVRLPVEARAPAPAGEVRRAAGEPARRPGEPVGQRDESSGRPGEAGGQRSEPSGPASEAGGRPGETAREPGGPAGWAETGWDAFLAGADRVDATAGAARAAAVQPGDVSDILFTSGTTGRSKGAMSTHRQALSVARAWADCGGLGPGDRYLVVNPFFHSFGWKAGILACLVTGAALIPQPVFDPATSMRLVEAEQITVLPGAPAIYQAILDHPERGARDLSSLRLAVTGAAIVPVTLVERMRKELGFGTVLTAYGLTEAVVATMCRPDDDPETVARTSGRATAGFEVRVAGPGGHPLPPGQPGEIQLRGPNVMAGYLDDPAATRAAIGPGGWLHTGDIGTLDEAGYLSITDRLTDMYICGGFNVYPAEVEQALARLDAVAESAVVGVPDPRLGEVGRAYVVLRPGHQLAAADVLAFCRERLANYKVPRQVEFRASLPRNPSGKVLKRVLRAAPPRQESSS